jgi:hypothetical protein
MCYAAYSKASAALVCVVLGTAQSLGVLDALEAEWSRRGSSFAEEAKQRARRVTRKAWRFEGEMHEIASTFSQVGLPQGFQSAAEVFRRLVPLKSSPNLLSLVSVLMALQAPADEEGSWALTQPARIGYALGRPRRLE